VSAIAKCIFILGALGLLSSCSPPDIHISIENAAGRLHLKLSQDWGLIFSDKQTPCVREVGLHEPESYERDRAAWLIEAQGDVQCLDLASVRVGDTPAGWRQVVPLSAVRGRAYTIRARGIGWGEARIRF
jgi:hypothetical protein